MDLINLAEFNEMGSECTISLKMDLEWFDERLRYESNDTSEVVTLDRSHYERIWVPKLLVPNVKEPGSLELNGQSNVISLKTRSDGYVFLRSKYVFFIF